MHASVRTRSRLPITQGQSELLDHFFGDSFMYVYKIISPGVFCLVSMVDAYDVAGSESAAVCRWQNAPSDLIDGLTVNL